MVRSMVTRGGINTVFVGGEYRHIAELDEKTLCEAWNNRHRELGALYAINRKANQGWRGVILKLIGVNLPDKNTIKLGGVNGKGEPLFESK